MVKLSKLTDYAVVVLVRLGQTELVQTTPGLAQATRLPEPTVAKVMKRLAAADVVTSRRGAHGGYQLSRPLARISLADVVAAVDGPIALTACIEGGSGQCGVQSVCAVRGRWSIVNDAIQAAFTAVTLAHFADPAPRRPARAARIATPAEQGTH